MTIDDEEWKNNFLFFYELFAIKIKEIKDALLQSSSTFHYVIGKKLYDIYRLHPAKSIKSSWFSLIYYVQCGNQKYVDNLSHIRLILEVDYAKLNSKQTNFAEDLINAAVPKIVKSIDAHKMIDDGVFQNIYSCFDMQKYGTKFLTHI